MAKNTVYIITGSSAINGRDLFLGAGRTRDDAMRSAYGRTQQRPNRGHYMREFPSTDAAILEYPGFEEMIMCEF